MVGSVKEPAATARLLLAGAVKRGDALLRGAPGIVEGVLYEIAGLLVIAYHPSQEGVERPLTAIQQVCELFQRDPELRDRRIRHALLAFFRSNFDEVVLL